MFRTVRRSVLAALVVGGGLVATVAPSTAQVGGPVLRAGENRRVGAVAVAVRGRDAPGLAVNPADPRHIVESEVDPRSGACHYNVSFDGGSTWAGGTLRAPLDFGGPLPCQQFDQGGYMRMDGGIAFGSGQNVYVAFDAVRPGAGDSVFVARSTDGGRTFAEGQLVMSGGPVLEPYFIRPKLGVLRRPTGDRVVVEAWGLTQRGPATFEDQQRRVVVSVSENGGLTWGAPVDAQPSDQAAREISPPAIAPDGTIYLAWRTQRNTANGFPAATPNDSYLSRSTDGGGTWSNSLVKPLAGFVGATHPRIALDPRNGTIYWVDNEAKVLGADPDVWLRRSTDGGVTWSADVRVNDDPTGVTVRQDTVNIALAANGRVDVIWNDRRHSYGGTGYADTFIASSSDGGRTFGPNRRVTDRLMNLASGLSSVGTTSFFAPALVPLGDNEILVAWADSRPGSFEFDNQDIYSSKVQVNPTGPPPIEQVPVAQPAGVSAALSRLAYPGGSEKFGGSAPVQGTSVVIVGEADTGAALVGGVLARANLGPLLASPSFGLPPDVAAEVTRLTPAQVFLIGDEASLSASVVSDLNRAGVPSDRIGRIAGSSPADTARRVAEAMVQIEQAATPARTVPTTAVVVNPASPEAGAAAALAAALRYPVLFTEAGSLPATTVEALASIGTTATLVIGGPGTIADSVLRQLPSALRVGGADLYGTAVAVMLEGASRGLPTDQIFVADGGRPVDAAIAGAHAARMGGSLLLAPGADAGAATSALSRLGTLAQVDALTVIRSVADAGPGYRLVARDGGVFAFGGARFLGSTGALRLARPVVGTASTPGGLGYWLVAADGGVFSFGDAAFAGSTGAVRLNRPMVAMAPTPSGQGYWLVAADGGVFAFGDAAYLGSTGGLRLNSPIVGLRASPSGRGYYLVAADGGVFAFGDAVFRGSTGAIKLNRPIAAMAVTPSGRGYHLVASDGGVFAFGDAVFRGSTSVIGRGAPIIGVSTTRAGDGYWLVASDGGVLAFGAAPFLGRAGVAGLAQPVVAVG